MKRLDVKPIWCPEEERKDRDIAGPCRGGRRPRHIWLFRVVVTLWACGYFGVAGLSKCASQELLLTTGTIDDAKLMAVQGDSVLFQTKEGERRIPRDEIVCWGVLCEPRGGEWLCLNNGSLIAGKWLGLANGRLTWRNDYLGEFSVTVDQVAGMIFRLPSSFIEKDLLIAQILDRTKGGYLLLANGDQLDGALLRRQDNGDLLVTTRFGERTFSVEQLRGVSLRRVSAATQGPIDCAVGLKDGSRIIICKFTRGTEDPASKDLAPALGDREIQGVLSNLLQNRIEDICFYQPFGNVVYLSDLAPETFIAVPFLEYVRPLKMDRNALGGWLRTEEGAFLKGIGTYSACRVRYNLQGRFSRFAAEVAIDACTQGKGSVNCHVLVDGERKVSVGPIRGGNRPVPVVVDVTGAASLDLVVDFGERADEQDYVNWLNARLIPATTSLTQEKHGN